MEYSIWTILIVVYGGIVFLTLVAKWFGRLQEKRYERREKYTVFEIRVSKLNESGPIVAEQIFSALHGVLHKRSIFDWFRGRKTPRISFEIANTQKNIKFFAWFPSKLKNLIEGQIYAQYPDIEIAEIKDYAKEGEGYYAELGFSDPDIYPIKRYPQFEDKLTRVATDPIAGVTATLAKLHHEEDQAAIQIIIRPLQEKWRITLAKCIKIIKKGIFLNIETLQKTYARMYITRSILLRVIFFPLYIIFFFQGLIAGTRIQLTTEQAAHTSDLEEETSRQHERETTTSAAMDKVVKLLFETSIRIVYQPKVNDPHAAELKLREMAGSFKQFNIPHLNGFHIHHIGHSRHVGEMYAKRNIGKTFILNNEELATIYHMPLNTVATPNIYWVKSRKVEPPVDLATPENTPPENFTMLGRTNFRGIRRHFGIRTIDRRRHLYILGKTGMGKSTLLENMIYSDIQSGKGIALIDPHGDTADRVIDFVPSNRINDVVIFDPSDRDYPVAFNMLENIDPTYSNIIASGLVGIFKKIYAESWGPRLEYVLRNTILALLEYPNATMLGITRMLNDRDFRRQVVKKVTDPIVKSFWVNEFEKMPDKQRMETISPIQNKVGQFLSASLIRNIVGQVKSSIDIRFSMDKKKIFIANLSKGKIGEDNSALLGAMLVTKFQLDAMSRANIPEKERTDYYLYVDEFQNFATEAFATILSEARKYKLNLTMANQYITQMPEEVRDAVFGNVGSLVTFQVGYDDAEYISLQFGEEVLPADLVSIERFNAYARMLIDLMPTKTFSMATLPPPEIESNAKHREKIRRLSRERYAIKREIIEDKIRRWHDIKDE